MKTIYATLLWTLILGGSLPALACPAFPSGELAYPLMCRGKLGFQQNEIGQIFAEFIKNPTSSGITGEKLQPGTCAWVDRPLNSKEPARIGRNIVAPSVHSVHSAHMIEACAAQSDCVFEFCAYTVDRSGFFGLWNIENAVRIRYPRF